MKDYIELEQIKKYRDEYKQTPYGNYELCEQNIFVSEHQIEIKKALERVNNWIKEGSKEVNEIFGVPICEIQHPVPAIRVMWFFLRDDGYLYFATRFHLATAGLGYRMKNGKVEQCL